MPSARNILVVLQRGALLAGVASVIVPAWIVPADAAKRRFERPGGVVSACSHFGHGCLTAPVRPSQNGSEVRLPGGTWIDCARDCRTKLTDETIDFWDRKLHEGAERPR